MPPLDELKQLDRQVETASQVGTLKPIYDRLEELARQHSGDFEVQLAVADVRQRVIDRGLELKRWRSNGGSAETATPPKPQPAAPPLKPASPPWPKQLNVRRALGIGAGLGVAAWLIVFVVLVQIARNRNMPAPPKKGAPGTVAVEITTAPPGARIRINGEEKCVSNCRVDLSPGNYQVTALLDGFDPGATGVTVVPGNPINVSLSLVSQTQTVRLYTDLEGGSVILDGEPAGDLQDGVLVLDRVTNGKHSVRIVGKMAEAAFSFEGQSGKQPVITPPVVATNILAVLVTSLGNQARILTSSAVPQKVALNGQLIGEAGALGLDLKNVPPGDQTVSIGEGTGERKLVVSFGQMPAVTAFLKSDVNTGTLVVSTGGEDDVTVLLNGREYRRKTRRGELRIQTVGNVVVQVSKPGFQPLAEQKVEIRKGEETRLAFQLRPLPKVASLQIRNGVPGTQILVDDRTIGRIGPDGSLSASNLTPGEHAIEIRREGFITKRLLRTLKPGETVQISGVEMALPMATGAVQLAVTPADAVVSYRRNDETQTRVAREGSLRLEPGTYLFTARAPTFVERTERVTVVAGETRNLEMMLPREIRPPAPAPPKVAKAPDWTGWSRRNGEYIRKGGNRVAVQSGIGPGVVTFTAHLRKAGGLFRAPKLRWYIEDDGGYSQFEVDKRRFSAKGPGGSRSMEYDRDGDDNGDKTFTIQVDVSPERIVHRMRLGGRWVVVDSRPNPGGGDARFGFVIPGNDEIAISDFNVAAK